MIILIRVIAILFSLFLSFPTLAATNTNAGSEPLDKIVAVVNSDVITQSQLDQQITALKKQLQSMGTPLPDDTRLQQQVLNQMIDQKLQLIVAKRTKVTVTEAQLDQAVTSIATRNHLTLPQLKVALVKEGMNYAAFREQINLRW